jgi:hypothetical protein
MICDHDELSALQLWWTGSVHLNGSGCQEGTVPPPIVTHAVHSDWHSAISLGRTQGGAVTAGVDRASVVVTTTDVSWDDVSQPPSVTVSPMSAVPVDREVYIEISVVAAKLPCDTTEDVVMMWVIV